MKNLVPGVLLVTLGTLTLLSGISANVWRVEGARYRIIAIVVGLIFLIMGGLGLLGYIEIQE
jgi:hypothetical protein